MGLVRDCVLYKMHGTAVDFAEFSAPLYTCFLDQPGGRRGGPRLGINHYSVIKSDSMTSYLASFLCTLCSIVSVKAPLFAYGYIRCRARVNRIV
jgi:hypothetical protein